MPDLSTLKPGAAVAIYGLSSMNRPRGDPERQWVQTATVTRNTGRRLYLSDGWHYNFDGSCADSNRTLRISADPADVAACQTQVSRREDVRRREQEERKKYAAREDVQLTDEILGYAVTHGGIDTYLRVPIEELRRFAAALRKANTADTPGADTQS